MFRVYITNIFYFCDLMAHDTKCIVAILLFLCTCNVAEKMGAIRMNTVSVGQSNQRLTCSVKKWCALPIRTGSFIMKRIVFSREEIGCFCPGGAVLLGLYGTNTVRQRQEMSLFGSRATMFSTWEYFFKDYGSYNNHMLVCMFTTFHIYLGCVTEALFNYLEKTGEWGRGG